MNEKMKDIFDIITSGASILITVIAGFFTLYLQNEKRAWENQQAHKEYIQLIGNINERIARDMWTIADMRTLYTSPEYWTNHIDAGHRDRASIIDDIAKED